MISLEKNYRTASGERVILTRIASETKLSYPVEGYVITNHVKDPECWDLQGHINGVGKPHERDLVECL